MERIKGKIFKIAVRIASWNGAKWSEENDCFAQDIIREAKEAGFTVTHNLYSGKLEPAYRYGESQELTEAYERITKRKRNYRNLAHRRKERDAKSHAHFYNVRHYAKYQNCPWIAESWMKRCARTARNLKKASKEHDTPEMLYWAKRLQDALESRREELAARMNYPEQVRYDLLGREISGLPF